MHLFVGTFMRFEDSVFDVTFLDFLQWRSSVRRWTCASSRILTGVHHLSARIHDLVTQLVESNYQSSSSPLSSSKAIISPRAYHHSTGAKERVRIQRFAFCKPGPEDLFILSDLRVCCLLDDCRAVYAVDCLKEEVTHHLDGIWCGVNLMGCCFSDHVHKYQSATRLVGFTGAARKQWGTPSFLLHVLWEIWALMRMELDSEPGSWTSRAWGGNQTAICNEDLDVGMFIFRMQISHY